MARFLLDRGAKVKVADSAGYTPLHGAALCGSKRLERWWTWPHPAPEPNPDEALAMVRRLLDAGADPKPADDLPTSGPAGDVRINPLRPARPHSIFAREFQ